MNKYENDSNKKIDILKRLTQNNRDQNRNLFY